MRLLDRVLLLTVIVCFLTTTTLSSSDGQSLDMLLNGLSPQPVQGLGDLVNGWNVMGNGEQETPGIYSVVDNQTPPDQNWLHSHGYNYLGVNSKTSNKVSTQLEIKNHLRQHDVLGDIALPNADYGTVVIPGVSGRNIIHVPTICPKGQRPDQRGICREVLIIPPYVLE